MYMRSDLEKEAMRIASQLRRAGIRADVDLAGRAFKKQLKASSDSTYAVIIAPTEFENDQIIIKDMKTGEKTRLWTPYQKITFIKRALFYLNIRWIIHPESDEEDVKELSDVLKVSIEKSTINGGVPYVSSGILANSKSIVTGSFTTGPEIMTLTRAFT